jgi:DNA ligase (NAD+)
MIKELAAITSVNRLEKLLLKHRDAYYAGKPTISDADYDKLEEQLRELDPNNAVLNAVGATTKFSKEEVELPVQMPSLNKVRGEAADKWILANPGPYTVSDKLDGVSIELEYQPGQPAKAYTRGDSGVTGRDISYLVPHMDIPQTMRKKLIVRGEMILSKANFQKYAEQYKNARNMVAGISNRKSLHTAVKDIHVVIYASLYPRAQPSVALANLKVMGFKVVGHKVVEGRLTSTALSKFLAARKKSSPYEIDGLVVEVDKKTAAPTSNPKHQVAFKETQQDGYATVKVVAVHWEVSRYGKMTPRVEIEAL